MCSQTQPLWKISGECPDLHVVEQLDFVGHRVGSGIKSIVSVQPTVSICSVFIWTVLHCYFTRKLAVNQGRMPAGSGAWLKNVARLKIVCGLKIKSKYNRDITNFYSYIFYIFIIAIRHDNHVFPQNGLSVA